MMGALALPAALFGGSIGSALIGRKTQKDLQKKATELTPEERAAQAAAMGSAGNLTNMGNYLYGQGRGNLGQVSSYYSTLLGRGGRGAMQSAVAPAAESIADSYGGVARALKGSNVRGGVRDLALAEAEREKTGRISRLTAGVQPMAASALGDIGRFQTATGSGNVGQAGGIYSDLLGQGRASRTLGYQAALESNRQGTGMGENIGSLLFTLLSSGGKGGGSRSIGYRGLPVGAG